jgi:uroporphyrinogen-III synthase
VKPLAGRTVLVTRPETQSHDFVAELQKLGATVLSMPAIQIAPPENLEILDGALREVGSCDWVVFTSVNGVRSVIERIDALGLPRADLKRPKVAAIGPATASEYAKHVGVDPDLVPQEFVSEAIAEAVGDVAGKRFLLPRADIARKDLANLLREKGAIVDEGAPYRIVPSDSSELDLPLGAPDFITLTSSSAARSTFEMLKSRGRELWFSQSGLVTIGPITSGTVRELGFPVAAEASDYTVPGLTRALIDLASKEPAVAR